MQEAEFEAYLRSRELAEKTVRQRIYALKRIERAHAVDLDDEFRRDGLEALVAAFTYTAADARAGRGNPSRMNIGPDKLATHLPWYRTHVVDYQRFCAGGDVELAEAALGDGDELPRSLIEAAVGRTFALERNLQAALRSNLRQLEDGLAIADNGAELHVEGGKIDILARDANGVLTVIELKAETARPESVAQILAYMSSVGEERGEVVRGILVAGDHHPRVRLAARAVPNLQLRTYRYRFDFE